MLKDRLCVPVTSCSLMSACGTKLVSFRPSASSAVTLARTSAGMLAAARCLQLRLEIVGEIAGHGAPPPTRTVPSSCVGWMFWLTLALPVATASMMQ